jgi:hypothetical protein
MTTQWPQWVESCHNNPYHLTVDELRYIWLPVWILALWPAFVFRPERLRTAAQSGPLPQRAVASLLGLIFCFGVAGVVAAAAMVVVGLAMVIALRFG